MENVKSLGVLLSPVSCTQASPKVEASNRPKQAQHLPTCRKVQNGNTRGHQGLSDSRGMGVVDRPIRCIPSHPHPPKLKEVPKVLPQVTGVPVPLPARRASQSPQVFTMIVKEVKLMALTRGIRFHQYLDDWLIRAQSQEEAQVITQTVVDLTQFLGWIINQERSELKPTRVFSFVGYKYHLDSALVKPTREMAQTSGFDPTTQVQTCFDCKMFDVANWVACLSGENRLQMRPFQFHLKEQWRYPQSLDSLLPWTETISAHLEWWQNPTNVMKGADLHPKDHSIQLFTDASNEGWGAHLEQASTKSLWSDREKRLHINDLELKAGSLALQMFKDQCQNQSVGCYGQLNSSSLHTQTRRNSLGRDVRSPVEDHDLVLSPDNLKSQTHSRVSECDGRPGQVEPSPVNRMVTASTGIQTDLSQVVHTSCRSICHSSEPQSSTVHISSLGHRCSEHKLVGFHCLCLPSHGSPSQFDPKNKAIQLSDHCNSPRLARDALGLGPSAPLNRDLTSTTSV